MIEGKGLAKTFATQSGERIQALSELDISVDKGEFVVIVGPSGCGKTTLLRILGGLIPYSEGSLAIGGSPVNGPRSDIGMVFQSPLLLPWRTVLENIMVPVDVKRMDRDTLRPRARSLLQLVGLENSERLYPSELSGGMQQRVAICRALINDPTLLLMDEPFGALDALTRESMNLELQRIWLESRPKTILFITHSIPEAIFLGDRVLVMSPRPGKIVDELRIEIERPRSLDSIVSEQSGAYAARVRGQIMSTGGID